MKRNVLLFATLALVGTQHQAVAAPSSLNAGDREMEGGRSRKIGFLIPSQCRPVEGAKSPEGPYDAWPAPHTTECALRKGCIESGYGLWVMGEKKFYRFDPSGQERALEYFKTTQRTSYNRVKLVGDFSDADSTIIYEMSSTD